MAALTRQPLRLNTVNRAAPVRAPVVQRRVATRALPDVTILADLAEAVPGSVDAPISVVIGGAIVVTIAATAIIPIWLNPGQEAAEKIFNAKQKTPLDGKNAQASKKKGK